MNGGRARALSALNRSLAAIVISIVWVVPAFLIGSVLLAGAAAIERLAFPSGNTSLDIWLIVAVLAIAPMFAILAKLRLPIVAGVAACAVAVLVCSTLLWAVAANFASEPDYAYPWTAAAVLAILWCILWFFKVRGRDGDGNSWLDSPGALVLFGSLSIALSIPVALITHRDVAFYAQDHQTERKQRDLFMTSLRRGMTHDELFELPNRIALSLGSRSTILIVNDDKDSKTQYRDAYVRFSEYGSDSIIVTFDATGRVAGWHNCPC